MSMWLPNLLSAITPYTRGFALRQRVYSAAGARVDRTAKINGTAVLSNKWVEVGAQTWIGAGCQLIGGPGAMVRIEDRCDLGPGVMLVVGNHHLGDTARRACQSYSAGITVGPRTWVGHRATFRADSSVDRGEMVAVGPVARGAFPDLVMIGGVPAHVLKQLDA
ncbi:acyltransferase [Micrococcus luteus]|uniref:acyltransferase n=1 Tax=Micrococcus luteus TaxID=1270 RepID=UPI0011AB2F39|nr:hypothetical protein [Micrococcus luteus]